MGTKEGATASGRRSCCRSPEVADELAEGRRVDTARGALAQGAADYLTKPFPFRYLDSVLAIHLPFDAELLQAQATLQRSSSPRAASSPERTQSAMPTPR